MTNVDIKELLLSGKNRLDVCNPFVYKQYKHFYSVGACRGVPKLEKSGKQVFGESRNIFIT